MMNQVTFVYGKRTVPITINVKHIDIYENHLVLARTIKIPLGDVITVRMSGHKNNGKY